MKAKPIIIGLGAIGAAAMILPFSNESRGGTSFDVAYVGDATQRLAQQETPPASAAPPKTTPQQEKKGPGWAVNCKSAATEQGLECRLSQTIVTQQGGELADVTFRIPADKKGPEAIVRLPLGVFLPAGATLQVDDKTQQKLNFRACDRNGCYAQAAISSQMLKELQEGQELKVSFKNLAEKQIDVPLSLDGFPEAYRKIF